MSALSNIDHLSVFTDGGSRGNPGASACAFVVMSPSNEILFQNGAYLGISTNNQAEYQGIIHALTWLQSHDHPTAVNFFSDSELVVKQLTGLYRVKDIKILPLFNQVRELVRQLTAQSAAMISFTHVPRSKNFLADQLVNSTLDQQ